VRSRAPNDLRKVARRLAPVAKVAGLSLAAAACGSDSSASTDAQPNTTTPSTTAGHSGAGSTAGNGGASF
jgi:hypothetical protein